MNIEEVNLKHKQFKLTKWEWYFCVIKVSTSDNINNIIKNLEKYELLEKFKEIFIRLNYPTTKEGWDKMWIADMTLHRRSPDEIKQKEREEINHLKTVVPVYRDKLEIN